jgi:hypothetical protein
MFYSVIVARLILLVFALALWVLVWSLRLLPGLGNKSALAREGIKITLAVAIGACVISEMLLYRAFSGQDSLRDDNFFFVAMTVQGLVGFGLALKSGSILKRNEKESGPDR